MRKIILLIVFCFPAFITLGQGKIKLGFQLSPTISANRVEYESVTESIVSDGTGGRIALGPIADFGLTDNYFLSAGLLFCSKRVGLEITDLTSPTPPRREEYSLQYVQIPTTMKLYTNEVGLDKRIYFQFGGSFDFTVSEKADENNYVVVDNFRFIDVTLLAGLGLDIQLGTSTTVYSGLSYHRGLVNAVSEQLSGLGGDLAVLNDYFALNVGIKF